MLTIADLAREIQNVEGEISRLENTVNFQEEDIEDLEKELKRLKIIKKLMEIDLELDHYHRIRQSDVIYVVCPHVRRRVRVNSAKFDRIFTLFEQIKELLLKELEDN
jgi:predicted RNase H-like nuclease (RuvC/YqgF family)